MKKNIISVILITILLFSFTGCANNPDKTSSSDTNSSLPTVSESGLDIDISVPASFTPIQSDTDSDWDSSAAQITLNGSSASVSGNGAAVTGSTVTITSGGIYVISGTLSNGQIVINAAKTDEVRIVLNGADITSQSGAPVYAEKAAKLIVTLASGSENRLTDGGSNFQYTDAIEEEPNAALFSKNDLTINGTGSLTVNANFKNGIGAKDNLLIVSGNITLTAANNALRGTDSVTVLDGILNLTSGNDGIQTGNNVDDKGNMQLEGGIFNIISGNDGIQSDNGLVITGGEYSITTGNGSSAKASDTSDSYKGIKAAAALTITNGIFKIDSLDDAIHANGNVSVANGTFTLSSGDDGIHSDTDLTITGGSIKITKSYEALEGSNIYISGGSMELTASDDGINAAGGSSNGTGGGFGPFGGDRFSGGGAHTIDIGGGSIKLYAGGDGLDSNNTINISGGTIIAVINSSADNNALDSDGAVTITGGTVIAGGTGTFENISGDSAESYVYLTGISAGSEITVQSGGQTLASYTTDKALSYLTIFAPGITGGQSYDVSVGGNHSSVTAGTGGGRGMGGPGGMGGFGSPGGRR